MLNRLGLNRFKKAESAEPFSVKSGSSVQQTLSKQQSQPYALPTSGAASAQVQPPISSTSTGSGGSNWQPPDWAVEPKPGMYCLEVLKEAAIVDKICLEKRRALFGRQAVMCDYVLDHPSVSRQHAAIVHHKNGGVYVIDLGSVHGTFVANERLSKDSAVELEVGQSLRFGASTRSYVLRKNAPTSLWAAAQPSANCVYPPRPDHSDEAALVSYNTSLNPLGVPIPTSPATEVSHMQYRNGSTQGLEEEEQQIERPPKRPRSSRVTFRDEYGGVLVEVVGISDGVHVGTEPGPVGVREGSLVGKYESLVQVTIIPKGHDDAKGKEQGGTLPGVTERLKQYLDKVKFTGKGGLYGDLYGDSLAGVVGGSWAGPAKKSGNGLNADEESTSPGIKEVKGKGTPESGRKVGDPQSNSSSIRDRNVLEAVEDNDLFGDSAEA